METQIGFMPKTEKEDKIKTSKEIVDFLKREVLESSGEYIYTYTSFESIVSIIKHRKLRLTRIDQLNDKKEQELNPIDNDKTYIMSFTDDAVENIHMWKMYGKVSGIKLKLGISKNLINNLHVNNERTQFVNLIKDLRYSNEDYSSFCNNYVKELSYVAYLKIDDNKETIMYNDKPLKKLQVTGDVKRALNGYLKYDCWRNEREIRLIVIDDNHKQEKYHYLEINDEIVKNLIIVFNPWLNEDIKEEIKNSLNNLAGCTLKYKNSIHNHEVDEL